MTIFIHERKYARKTLERETQPRNLPRMRYTFWQTNGGSSMERCGGVQELRAHVGS